MTPWKRWQEQVSACGAIPTLLQALSTHPMCSKIQAYACGAIGNLVFGNPDNQRAVLEADGISKLLMALESHVHNEAVITFSSFWLLNTVVAGDLFRAEIVALGGCTTLLGAMRAHPNSCPIMTNCCLVIQVVATQAEGSAEQMVDQEVIELIVESMKTHSGCNHLGTLGGSSAHLTKLHASRAFLREACGALACLMKVEANHEKLRTAEIKLLVQIVLRSLPQDQQLAFFANQLLDIIEQSSDAE